MCRHGDWNRLPRSQGNQRRHPRLSLLIGDHYAPSIRDANTIPAAFKERKLNAYFEITSLLAERRLRKKETASGASKIQSVRDRKVCTSRAEIQGI
jgi:hypothetical protein